MIQFRLYRFNIFIWHLGWPTNIRGPSGWWLVSCPLNLLIDHLCASSNTRGVRLIWVKATMASNLWHRRLSLNGWLTDLLNARSSMLSVNYFCINYISDFFGSTLIWLLVALGLHLWVELMRLVGGGNWVIEVINYLSVVVLGGDLKLVVILMILTLINFVLSIVEPLSL